MDHIEETDSPARFVCLKVAHQMPARSFAPQFDYLALGFLDSILAKIGDAGGEPGFQCFRWLSLANRNQGDLISRAIRPPRGCFDPTANARKSFAESFRCEWFLSHVWDVVESKRDCKIPGTRTKDHYIIRSIHVLH